MKTKNEISAFYDALRNFPRDVHKDKKTFYFYSHINEIVSEKYAADPEKFKAVFSLRECLKLPYWARTAVIGVYENHGQMKKMLCDYKEYLSRLHIGGAGELYTDFGKIDVDDNVCMESLAGYISSLSLKGEAPGYPGDEPLRWTKAWKDEHMCEYTYMADDEDFRETCVRNSISIFSDNHIEVRAGTAVDMSLDDKGNITDFVKGMNDTDFPAKLDLVETDDPDTCIFELSYDVDEERVYDILKEEEKGFDRRDAAVSHVLFGISHKNVMAILPRFYNVLDGIHTPEEEVMYYEADEDENCHYETPNEARYFFEHKILPDMFFYDPKSFMEILTEEGMDLIYNNFRQRCERRNIRCIYKKEDFRGFLKNVEGKEIVRIVLPLPKREYDCFEINMVISRMESEETGGKPVMPRYFTVERGKSSKERYLCEWDEEGEHYNHGACTASAGETLNEILSWVRG